MEQNKEEPTSSPNLELKEVNEQVSEESTTDLNKKDENIDEKEPKVEDEGKNEKEIENKYKQHKNEECGFCLNCKCFDYGEIKHNTVEDAEVLKDSMGYFLNETTVNSILGHRNYAEIEAIIKRYNEKYLKNLEDDINNHTSSKYNRALISILKEPSLYYTKNIQIAVQSKNSDLLIELLLTRNNKQKQLIKRIYSVKYGTNLQQEIISKFSSKDELTKELLLSLLNNIRDEEQTPSTTSINEDSIKLYQSGEAIKGQDVHIFIDILTRRSFEHLSQLNLYYKNSNPKRHSLEKAIELEFSNCKQFRISLLDILLYAKDSNEYWAKSFHNSLYSSLKELDLTRLTITQQSNVADIKQSYLSLYNTSLITEISSKTSSKYKKLILSMLTV